MRSSERIIMIENREKKSDLNGEINHRNKKTNSVEQYQYEKNAVVDQKQYKKNNTPTEETKC